MLLALMEDQHQESRINARKAILTLEYGDDALPNRLEIASLLSLSVKRESDQARIL